MILVFKIIILYDLHNIGYITVQSCADFKQYISGNILILSQLSHRDSAYFRSFQ